ncbi:MAG: exopolysaccharide biosynthesis protein [Solirubrobacterales bacterium]|jgi:hypothetical protein|nr:exopolysaccharide biosynthesis protein [Solirubrobacterales bacterium]
MTSTSVPARTPAPANDAPTISRDLEGWLNGRGDKTLHGLIEVFDEKAFALLFVLLLGVSALPIPTGGATHVFDIVAVLVAAQLVLGREHIWIPKRWQGLQLAGAKQQKFLNGMLKAIRKLERVSRPRLRHLLTHRLSNIVFGVVVILLTAAAFFAPPFSGLDTLPALGVVLISLGVLLEDALIAVVGLIVGVVGVILAITVGSAALHGVSNLI